MMLARLSTGVVNPPRRRVVVLVTLVCFFAACHKWVPIESPVEQALAGQSGKVRITNNESVVAELETTWIARDSVFGVTKGDTMAVALSEVVAAEQQKSDVPATVGLVVGGLAVGFGLVVAVIAIGCADGC
jgi:hypothetical protein